MTNLEVLALIVILLVVIGGGVILYLALAGLAIIYSMGANESPKGRRKWRKRGLMAPLQPQETPEYSFSDLQMNLYNTIYL